jgi:hypothetical protein
MMPEPADIRIRRSQAKRADGLSSTLQVAKAAEHLVCADLILQGWNAMIADAGQPYDIVVDLGDGRFSRVQVKCTTRMYERAGCFPVYRFALRRSRTGDRAITLDGADMLALVALDRKLIAWIHVETLRRPARGNKVAMLIEFKTRQLVYTRRRVGAGGFDPATVGKFIEDFAVFDPLKAHVVSDRAVDAITLFDATAACAGDDVKAVMS